MRADHDEAGAFERANNIAAAHAPELGIHEGDITFTVT